jgi:hypothetical protein
MEIDAIERLRRLLGVSEQFPEMDSYPFEPPEGYIRVDPDGNTYYLPSINDQFEEEGRSEFHNSSIRAYKLIHLKIYNISK